MNRDETPHGAADEEWPTVGRSAELAAVTAAAEHGEHALLVVSGPAGIGKSVLLQRLADALDDGRFVVLRATAGAAGRDIPFAALGHLLPAPPESPANLIGWARDALLADTGGRRPVLCIDDSPHLDEVSLALLTSLVLSRAATVVVTVRSADAARDPLHALARGGTGRIIELEPLSQAETDELLERALGGHVHPTTRQRVWQLAEGNPLHVRELVRAADRDRSIQEENGVITWDGRVPLAPGLVGLLEDRVADLGEDERRVMDVVAFGEPVRLDVLERLGATAALELVEDKGLVLIDSGPTPAHVRMAHPLYGEVVRAQCPKLRHRRIVRDLADATAATAPDDPDELLRLAVWRLESGSGDDPALLHQACRTAFAANMVPLAARLGWAAVNAGGGPDVALTLASVLNYCEQPAEADAVLSDAARVATTEAERVRIATSRAYTLQYGFGDSPAAARLLSEALTATDSPVLANEVRAEQGQLLVMGGALDAGVTVLERVIGDPAATPATRALALTSLAAVRASSGQHADAKARLREVLDGAAGWRGEAPFNELKAMLLDFYADLLIGRVGGDSEGAIATARQRATVQWDWEFFVGMMSWVLGQGARLRGRVAEARRLCGEAIAGPRPPGGAFGFVPAMLGELAHVHALLGERDAAEQALTAAESARTSSMDLFNHGIDVARPWVTACGGDLAAALEQCLASADRAREAGVLAFEVIALHDAVRLGGLPGLAGRLREVAAELDDAAGPFVTTCVEHAAGQELGDGAALAAVASRFADLDLTLLAAEAAAQSAAAFRRSGDARAGDREAARAAALAARCEGATTPALAGLTTPGLTRREQEIAHLAATGMTSRAIAEQLVTSVRTVDNHLARVYAKLGIEGRGELADLLAQPHGRTEPSP